MLSHRGVTYLSIAEIAKRLNVTRRTVYSWRSAGRLSGSVRLMNKVLYPDTILDTLLHQE